MAKRRFLRRRMRSYPRRQMRRFKRGKAPIPLLPVMGGVVAPMLGAFNSVGGMSTLSSNPSEFALGMVDQICQRYTGFAPLAEHWGRKPEFNISWMIPTYTGLFAGLAGHMIANKLGVNRQFKRIPIVGKYAQL